MQQELITLPYGGWKPRWYQDDFWKYMDVENPDPTSTDGKHAELIWHRRAGKDEVCLHLGAIEMIRNPATYWHMLPQANQVRKAIWEAINPHTGIRRIKEAFPEELFTTRETDMMVKCKVNGATWQCMGSDNYQSAIGSPPRGITYSEWALANPSVRGYLRPIIAENKGWQAYITTPRGKNHAYSTYRSAIKNSHSFAQKLTIYDTKVLSPEQLRIELDEYVDTYGESYGISLYEQEYECSFDAAIIGSIWGQEVNLAEKQGRICDVGYDDRYPVHTCSDLGRSDDLSVWWYQVIDGQIRVLEHWAASGKDPDTFASQLLGRETHINIIRNGIEVEYGADIEGLAHRRAYNYGSIGIPHDGAAKTFSAKGKSVEEQLAKVFGWRKIVVIPRLSKQDQIQAGRKAIRRAVFDFKCEDDQGLDGLREYQRIWDDEKKMFNDAPLHNWCSHSADSWMQLAVAWDHELLPKEYDDPQFDNPDSVKMKQMIDMVKKRRRN